MDIQLRLKALGRLVESSSKEAQGALAEEFQKAIEILRTSSAYSELDNSLQILAIVGHRFSDELIDALKAFFHTIEKRKLTHPGVTEEFRSQISEYHGANSLIERSVEVLSHLRLVRTEPVLLLLLEVSVHKIDSVRKKAIEALRQIAKYDLNLFYGEGDRRGIGAVIQMRVVGELARFKDEQLSRFREGVLVLMEGVLAPTIEGTKWTYKAVTISRGQLPAVPELIALRKSAIQVLIRVYGTCESVKCKFAVISTMLVATRGSDSRSERVEFERAVANDCIDVLKFFIDLIEIESLQILERIESSSFWIFYHSESSDVRAVARQIEQLLARDVEYTTYKTLIGFEGVFEPWENLKKSRGQWKEREDYRKAKAEEYVDSIQEQNSELWTKRILRFSETESDDLATFPVFYFFLERIGHSKPEFALSLIEGFAGRLERFLVPLLRGVWGGRKEAELRAVLEDWLSGGRYLWQISRLFLDNASMDLDLVERVLQKAIELKDVNTEMSVLSVAVSNFQRDGTDLVRRLFLPALRALTGQGNSRWIFDFWFRREAMQVVKALDEESIDLLLQNLSLLEEIDYHAEEILYLIAQSYPEKVVKFFLRRLSVSAKKGERLVGGFEAIPYAFSKLHEPLALQPKVAVGLVLEHFREDATLFAYKGGRFLKAIFPNFAPELEAELLSLLRNGDSKDCEFVLGILRNYEGEPFLHAVAKELVLRMPESERFRNELAIALQNTGVVSGEFGFVQAYERKKTELSAWTVDENEKVRSFAVWYLANLDQMIASERQRAEEEIALRKHRFGE